MRIATAQNIIESDIEQNASHIEDLIISAADDGADFIHFPEGALSGYVKAHITNWSEVDWKAIENSLQKIKNLCAMKHIGAAIGCAHNHPDMERPFNSLYVIDSSGEITARYDKRLCSHSEISDWYSAGNKPVFVYIKGMKLGFALCIEVQFPEIFMEYERLNTDCVLLSAYSESEMFKIQAQGHAACSNYWISYCVPANASHKQDSCFIGPDGTVADSCEQRLAGYIINEIDPDAEHWDIPCKKARPWRKLAHSAFE